MVDKAREKLQELVAALLPFAKQGIAIVGLEPSCLLTLRDEALVMGLGEDAKLVSEHAFLLEEFLANEAKAGKLDVLKAKLKPATKPFCCTATATKRLLALFQPNFGCAETDSWCKT